MDEIGCDFIYISDIKWHKDRRNGHFSISRSRRRGLQNYDFAINVGTSLCDV